MSFSYGGSKLNDNILRKNKEMKMECNNLKSRKLWIDLSKVILIYLMIVCHLGVPKAVDTIIVSFHMSAFFLISGYLHKDGKWWISTQKAVKRLLIPVLFFNFLGYIVWFFKNIDVPFSLKEYITKPILGLVMLDPSVAHPMCMPMWFCIALFFAKVLSLTCNVRRGQIILLVTCFIASILFLNVDFSGSNFVGRIFLATMFYIMGYILKKSIDKLLFIKSYFKVIFMIVALIALCVIALHNGRPTWLNYEFGKFFLLFICTSMLGASITFVFSSLVYRKAIPIITYLSNNTLTILGVHLLLFPLIPHINHFIGGFLVLMFCLPIIWVFNKLFPTLIGNMNTINKIK